MANTDNTQPTSFKIGDFAKLAHVSISKLRYYDEIGLLKPSIRSQDSSYRFYDSSQLDRIATIKSFQRHGMSLQQMNALLHNKNSFFKEMAKFSEDKVAELNRQIDTLIRMRSEYENLALTYPVLDKELSMNQFLYAPVPSYKIIKTDYYEKDFFNPDNDNAESHFYMQKFCSNLNSVQWFASDTGYQIDLSGDAVTTSGLLLFRLSNRHPQISSDYMETLPAAEYVRYLAPMNKEDVIKNIQEMSEYCTKINRIPESHAFVWFMVDDYEDGTGKPIIQICIPLKNL